MFEGISWRGELKKDNDELMAQRINWCKEKKNLSHDNVLWYRYECVIN